MTAATGAGAASVTTELRRPRLALLAVTVACVWVTESELASSVRAARSQRVSGVRGAVSASVEGLSVSVDCEFWRVCELVNLASGLRDRGLRDRGLRVLVIWMKQLGVRNAKVRCN